MCAWCARPNEDTVARQRGVPVARRTCLEHNATKEHARSLPEPFRVLSLRVLRVQRAQTDDLHGADHHRNPRRGYSYHLPSPCVDKVQQCGWRQVDGSRVSSRIRRVNGHPPRMLCVPWLTVGMACNLTSRVHCTIYLVWPAGRVYGIPGTASKVLIFDPKTKKGTYACFGRAYLPPLATLDAGVASLLLRSVLVDRRN